MTITSTIVVSAKAGDLTAVGQVTAATDGLIAALAREAATKVASGGGHAASMAEEFESVGRVALWEAISGWDAKHASGASAETFLFKRVRGAIADAVYSERNPGADPMAMRTFMRCLKTAQGDAYLAERLAQHLPDTDRRLSADRAQAARMAYQGTLSLDAPSPGGDEDSSGNLSDHLSVPFDVPDDLVTASDLNQADRKARHALVHAVLDTMTPLRREVLKARAEYGQGKDLEMSTEDVAEVVAGRMGKKPRTATLDDAWRKGCAQFRETFPLYAAYGSSK
ncbi:sigma-70 family RNA polymerase sigma factor [Streptomyces avermitilis]|uniref:hypothetical protein n=1 Tax=Streptomyces avermitilis TaxID=33903 RepID=UPI00380A0F00